MSSGLLQAWECFPFPIDIIFGEFRIVLLIDDLQGDLCGRLMRRLRRGRLAAPEPFGLR